MKWLLCLSILIVHLSTYSQQKYWIYFHDKSDTTGIPSGFCEQAVQRRISQQIHWQFSDYPLNHSYIQKIQLIADSLGYESRWLNAVAAWVHPDSLIRIQSLPFVKNIEKIESNLTMPTKKNNQKKLAIELKKLADLQIETLGASLLKKNGLNGNGFRICIIDAGFKGASISSGLKHIYQRNGIVATYDFIRKKSDVYVGSVHGTYVLSCLGGKTDSMQTGLATGATYLLARTESVWSESQAEEDRWIAALEWADQQGAHIINCSMGYARPKYKKADLNGESTLSKAMNMASDKGMLVVNAAGNEYNNTWKTLILPADAEKVLTVGALQTTSGQHAWFSSSGPTADGRIKPELTAPGTVVAWGGEKPVVISGTSFSAPLIAGLAACIWQYYTDTLKSSLLKKILIQSGCWWPYYDYRLGYGTPITENLLSSPIFNIHWEIFADSTQLTILFSAPLAENEKLYYKIDKLPGEFELYGFVEMKKEMTKVNIPWKTFYENAKMKIKNIKIYSGKILWIKWRNQQKEVIIP